MLTGDKLGRYEILEKIGLGGMGEVFLATDESLGRKVALKVLLPEFTQDEDRVKRFVYEARAVSKLNHPGILTVHEISADTDLIFFSTEFVDGETLRAKIENKSLDLCSSISIARQAAEALSVAHASKIVHRDVKPENIMVRKDGIAKLLDFGLAKPLPSEINKDENEKLLVKTIPGLVIGSVRYMSPEQARGVKTDERTDIWSLGVVLYEMLTGNTPFDGETVSDQLAALIHKDPKPLVGIPAPVEAIVRKCLAKDANARFASATELADELKNAASVIEKKLVALSDDELANTIALPIHLTSENATLIHQTISSDKTESINHAVSTRGFAARSDGRSPLVFAGIVAVLCLLGVGAVWAATYWFGSGSISYDSIRASRVTDDGKSAMAAVSPDGKLIAFVESLKTGSRLMLRQSGAGSKAELVAPNGEMYATPEFSRDGDYVYYVSFKSGVGKLFRVSSLGGGGESEKILEDIDSKPAVSPDGKSIAFYRHDPTQGGDSILIGDQNGKNLKTILKTKDSGLERLNDLAWSADGKNLIISSVSKGSDSNARCILTAFSAVDGSRAEMPELRDFEDFGWVKAFGMSVLTDGSGLIFIGKRAQDEPMQIWHMSFATGLTKPITTDTSDYKSVSVSDDGQTLIATKAEWTSGLISVNRESKETKQIKPESKRVFGTDGITITADGELLYSAREKDEINIFSFDPKTGTEVKLTAEAGYNIQPAVSSNGDTIVFASTRGGGGFAIWKMSMDGSKPVKLSGFDKGGDIDPVLIDGDRTVVFVRRGLDGGPTSLMKVPVAGGEASKLSESSTNSYHRPMATSDGRKLAWSKVEFDSKALEVTGTIEFAKIENGSFQKTDVEIPISYEDRFMWSRSGDSFIRTKIESDGQLWEVSIDGKTENQITNLSGGEIRSFCLSADGKEVYIVRGTAASDLVLIKPHEQD